MSRVCALARAGDPLTLGWLETQREIARTCERWGFPTSHYIAAEQVHQQSATRKICHLCGHPTSHRQTTEIVFPANGHASWICGPCDGVLG